MSHHTPVSIAILAYNEEKTIGAVLEYFMHQNPDLVREIIVGANGCTDNTELVVEEKADLDERIKLLTSEVGRPNAWNALVSSALQDTVLFFDADNRLGDTTVVDLIDNLDPEQVIITGATLVRVDSESRSKSSISGILDRDPDQFYLAGGGFGIKKSKLLSRMDQYGYSEMPRDIFAEDRWLQGLLNKDELVIVKSAHVYTERVTFENYLERVARRKLSHDQLRIQHPAVDANLKGQSNVSGWGGVYRRYFNQDKPLWEKLLDFGAYITRQGINLIYHEQINKKYSDFKSVAEDTGYASVLRTVARRHPTE